ncbi:MAG: hypothetical protein ACMUJM_24895 [bacterium]
MLSNKKGLMVSRFTYYPPYDEARLPQELADLVHGADPIMVIRIHEERKRSATNT